MNYFYVFSFERCSPENSSLSTFSLDKFIVFSGMKKKKILVEKMTYLIFLIFSFLDFHSLFLVF
jgi:hypothetical protein